MELTWLRDAISNAHPGSGAFCFVAGEAGAGKSALLAELRKQVVPGAGPWLVGRCSADRGAPTFWPWREITAQLMAHATAQACLGEALDQEHELVRAFPELGGSASVSRRVHPPSAEERFFVCERFVARLSRLAQVMPLFIVVEDVHWADDGSLLLLETLGRATTKHPIHLFVSYRPEAVVPGKMLSKLLANESDRDGLGSLHLNGLTTLEIQTLLTRLEYPAEAPVTAEYLKRLSGGNALFVRQLVAQFGTRCGPSCETEHPTLTHVVLERVSSLPAPTLRLLNIAAVLGSDCTLALLGSVADLLPSQLSRELSPAIGAGVVRKIDNERMEFSHALLRDALYQSLPPAWRQEVHAAALAAWEALPSSKVYLSSLASHAFLAGPAVTTSRKQELCRDAGRQAFEALAFDSAVVHFSRAVELLDDGAAPAKAELAPMLARARWEADEPLDDVRKTYFVAAEYARLANSAPLLAEAALGCAIGAGTLPSLQGQRVALEEVRLLEEALDALDGAAASEHGALKHWLARTLCAIRFMEGDNARAEEALRVCVLHAAPPRDAWTLALSLSLSCTQALLCADIARARDSANALCTQMMELELSAIQRIELGFRLLGYFLVLGDLQNYEKARHALAKVTDALPQPPQIGRVGERMAVYKLVPVAARVTIATIQGDFAEAERRAEIALELAESIRPLRERYRDDNAFLTFLQLRGYQGRACELEPALAAHLEQFPENAWEGSVAKAQFAIERGALKEAKQHYQKLSATGFRVPRAQRLSPSKLETRVRMADVCSVVGSADDALVLYESLLPEAHLCAHAGFLLSLGSTHRPLGALAHKLGRYPQAEQHFRRALEINERFGHRPEVVRARLGLAKALRAMRRSGEAEAESAAALAEAKEKNMKPSQ